jgi:hypothetical protein
MCIEETYIRHFYDLHKSLHGNAGYDERYVIMDTIRELQGDGVTNIDEILLHCILDGVTDEKESNER